MPIPRSDGVCRDFARLAVTLCRCMNIRRAIRTGISATSACRPRIRRWISARGSKPISPAAGIPRRASNSATDRTYIMARGRDATDVALVTSFGPCTLAGFQVFTDDGQRRVYGGLQAAIGEGRPPRNSPSPVVMFEHHLPLGGPNDLLPQRLGEMGDHRLDVRPRIGAGDARHRHAAGRLGFQNDGVWDDRCAAARSMSTSSHARLPTMLLPSVLQQYLHALDARRIDQRLRQRDWRSARSRARN